MESANDLFAGLSWEMKSWSLEPQWTVEPDLDSIKRTIESLRPSATVKVASLAQGAFNKLYKVELDDQALVMRVSLPVDPQHKTLSEVATVDYVRRHTSLPVPEIIAHQASRGDPVGFEWILMSRMLGRPLGSGHWKAAPWKAKLRIVQQLAESSACLFRHQLRGIGNLYPVSGGDATDEHQSTQVGRIVSIHFFWADHIKQDVPRGPFKSSLVWLEARLALSEHDCGSSLARLAKKKDTDLTSDDEDDIDDAERTLRIVKRLKRLVPTMFPPSEEFESTMLFHDDLSKHNILVDSDGNLAGVVDWECVSALPLWRACYYPAFLEDLPRETKPDLGRYKIEDGGQPTELYWDHMEEYELTVLRRAFLEEMRTREPRWMEVYNSSQMKRDLETAVQNCDNAFVARHINAWVDDVVAGTKEMKSLRDRIDQV